jgi:hypothetical protein
MSRYEGIRTKAGPIVMVNGELLDLRLDLRNHSPTGFEWGYCGSGPAQLALAILAHHLEDDEQTLNLYQRFKWTIVVELPRSGWTLTTSQLNQILEHIRAEDTAGGVV